MIDLGSTDALLARFARELDPPPTDAVVVDAPAEDRDIARVAWASRIIDEYRSVVVFAELLQLLGELEAPFDALCAVHRLIGDELRHARLSAQVCGWLGGARDLAIDLSDIGLPPRAGGETKGRRAFHIVVRELVVAEEESIHVLAAYRDATTHPAIRSVLAGILRDEVRHAAAGRSLARAFDRGALAASITDDDRADLPALIAADRAELRSHYRASARGGAGRALGGAIDLADLDTAWSRVTSRRDPIATGTRSPA
jgi:hypothetical protein